MELRRRDLLYSTAALNGIVRDQHRLSDLKLIIYNFKRSRSGMNE
jgi:hypothetical protein